MIHDPEAARLVQSLTGRQVMILAGLARSENVKTIAADLHLSTKTVEYHRSQVYHRTGIRDLAGLTRFAIRTGLVEA